MPALTAIKARQMILEASRQHSQTRESTFEAVEVNYHAIRVETTRCKHCKGKHLSDDC